MTAQIIDGRKIAMTLKGILVEESRAAAAAGLEPGLATVSIGSDYSSQAYEDRIRRIAGDVKIPCRQVKLPESAVQADAVAIVRELNADPAITGILVLRPLPDHIDESEVFRELDPLKDIESVHPENAGLLALGVPRYVPSTAAAIFHVLDSWLDEVGEDRVAFYHRCKIVVVGRSNNVGKPAISLAYDRQAAVTSVDKWASVGNGLGAHTRRADVLVVAAGVPGLIRAEHVREGAIVLDVGINPVIDPETGATVLVGDVAAQEVAARARAMTPVPGGIGPVTDVWLVRNAVTAAWRVSVSRERLEAS